MKKLLVYEAYRLVDMESSSAKNNLAMYYRSYYAENSTKF